MSISTRRFLQIALAIIAFTVMSAFSSITASAQCGCINTIRMDPAARCCVQLRAFSVQCDDGSIQAAFPGAGPFDNICQGQTKSFPCPCPNSINAFIINGAIIPVGSSMDVLYGGDCCLHFSVNSTPGGCISVIITNGTLCYLDKAQPSQVGSLMQVWPYARG